LDVRHSPTIQEFSFPDEDRKVFEVIGLSWRPSSLADCGPNSLINRIVNIHFESDKAFGPSRSPWALLAQVIDLWILRQNHLQICQILCIEMNTPRIDAQDLDSEATIATHA